MSRGLGRGQPSPPSVRSLHHVKHRRGAQYPALLTVNHRHGGPISAPDRVGPRPLSHTEGCCPLLEHTRTTANPFTVWVPLCESPGEGFPSPSTFSREDKRLGGEGIT